MDKTKLEREGGAPEGWETDVVLERDASGEVVRVEIPDDKEADGDAEDG